MNDMQRMADLAESLADAGHDGWSIARELRNAADESSFGWAGAKHFGSTAGVIPESEADLIQFRMDALHDALVELIEDNPRSKTVRKEFLTGVLEGETE